MRQVVQSVSGGPVRVVEVPRPTIGPTEVLVQTLASVISSGTERAVTGLAQSNLLAKAKARPDLVRQVVRKARADGPFETLRAVRSRLGSDMPLGYSAAGIAIEVGEAVAAIAPGQLVATGGAGKANHAEFQAVPGLLCVPLPDGVSAEDGAFATIASVALHALRLAGIGPGDRVVIIGLGLIGQLAVRLAQASGCEVAGIDVSAHAVDCAAKAGALGLEEAGADTTDRVLRWSRGRGADAVLLAASGHSSAVIQRTPALCRDRATVVLVGDLGLELERTPFYEKELSLRFARSYGPGRYDTSYEDWAVDYPPGHVRWTEGRNLEAVLDLLADQRLRVSDLVTHRFELGQAADAYELLESRSEPYVAVQLTYPAAPTPDEPIRFNPTPHRSSDLAVGVIGAGGFASSVLVPALKEAGFERLVSVASASGLSARRLAEAAGFEVAVTGADAVIEDPYVDVVVIATPHDSHARLAAQALRAGKHVFCEKPLALTIDELDDVEDAWRRSAGVLFVGFNRRWSEPVARVKSHLASGAGELVITYRVNAGTLPPDHWYNDRRQGGRLVGEVCHFIDTCSAIVGKPVSSVTASGSTDEALLSGGLVVSLTYLDGSVAAITYSAGGSAKTPKEYVEVLGRSHSATIKDFAETTLDGTRVGGRGRDKGHLAQARAFHRACLDGDGREVAASFISSSRITLLAADSYRSRIPHAEAASEPDAR